MDNPHREPVPPSPASARRKAGSAQNRRGNRRRRARPDHRCVRQPEVGASGKRGRKDLSTGIGTDPPPARKSDPMSSGLGSRGTAGWSATTTALPVETGRPGSPGATCRPWRGTLRPAGCPSPFFLATRTGRRSTAIPRQRSLNVLVLRPCRQTVRSPHPVPGWRNKETGTPPAAKKPDMQCDSGIFFQRNAALRIR